ncbi:MAG: hypothetical protein ACOC5M_02955, partial [Chloroflexota bacterium]
FTSSHPENGLTTILATTDLSVDTERFAYVLTSKRGIVSFPVMETRTYYYPNGFEGEREGPVETESARFHEFPFGTRGVYVADFNFDRVGAWSFEVSVPRADGSTAVAEHRFQVSETASAPVVGQRAPLSETKTLNDAELTGLSTGSQPDPDLYQTSVAEAIEEGRPFVVVFASPAFCTNAVCGPQVEVLSELQVEYGDRLAFIHVDIFADPAGIQGDIESAARSPALEEWGIPTDEWTFVVNSEGVVTARFEGFSPSGEVEEAIRDMLG